MQTASMQSTNLDDFQLELGSSSEIALAIALFVMMLSVALSLVPVDFKKVLEKPRPYFAGVIGQIIGLPLLTYIICLIVNPHPTLALGMLIVACCPGGTVSNLISMIGKANVALSVSMTATSSLFAAFCTPVTILFWTSLYGPTAELLQTVDFSVWQFLKQTFVLLAVPLTIGMSFRHFFPEIARKISKPLSLVAFLLLMVIIVAGLQKYWRDFLEMGAFVIGLAIVHNILAFILGYLMGVISGADRASKRALTIEIGIQNSGLAIVILLTALAGFGGAAAIIGVWGTWHIVAGLVLISIFRWQDRRIQNV